MNQYKHFIGTEIDTESGKAVIMSACGKYGTLQYKNCSGIGWVDLSTLKQE